MLAAEQGSELMIEAIGLDSDAAVEAIYGMIDNGFGEN